MRGIFLTQQLNPGLLYYHLSHEGGSLVLLPLGYSNKAIPALGAWKGCQTKSLGEPHSQIRLEHFSVCIFAYTSSPKP